MLNNILDQNLFLFEDILKNHNNYSFLNNNEENFLFPSFDIYPDNSILNAFEVNKIENTINQIVIKKKSKRKKKNKKNRNKKTKPKILFAVTQILPQLYLEDDIINIITKKIENEDIKDILSSNYNLHNTFINNIKEDLIVKDKKRNKVLKEEIKEDIKESKQILPGRKKKFDETVRSHNKFSPDNIMNKIRNILKKYLVLFVNNIIYNLYNKEQKNQIFSKFNIYDNSLPLIKYIDYKSLANRIKREENLDLLDLTINSFLSFDISNKYKIIKNKSSKFNQIVIEYLLSDIHNKDLFDFIFNILKIEDWLDIFIYKKDFLDFPVYTSFNEEKQKIIENSLVRIDNIFPKLNQEDNSIYFTCLLLLIYNYRRYYLIKQGRKDKKPKKKSD